MKGAWFFVQSDGYAVTMTPENADRFLVKLNSSDPLPVASNDQASFVANKLHEWLERHAPTIAPSKDGEGSSKS